MVHLIHQFFFYLHVVLGSMGLLVFWLPVLGKKGTKFHKQFGKVFVYTMYSIAISGIIMSLLVLIDPVGVRFPERGMSFEQAYQLKEQNRQLSVFLLMLSLLVFVNVKQSILVLKAKANRELLKTPSHLACIGILLLAGISVGLLAIQQSNLLFGVFAVLSIALSTGTFKYIYKAELKPREWVIEHMGNILGAGIGAYTAFFAFGGRRFFSEVFLGNMQIIPWVLPAIVGLIVTPYLTKKYRKTYRIS